MATEQQQSPAGFSGIVRRSIDIDVRAFDEDERSFDVVASTDTIDGHGDIVEQSFDLKRYKKNSVVLWQHNAFGTFDGSRAEDFLPIGRAKDVKVEGGKLTAKIYIVKGDGPDSITEKIWRRVQQGVLRAVSIGFRPGKVTKETNTKTGKEILRLADNELFEISVVTIPSNPDAVAKSIAFEHQALCRIAAQTAAEAEQPPKAIKMDIEVLQKQLETAKVELGVEKTKLTEATDKIKALETALTAEKTASAKLEKDLGAANVSLKAANAELAKTTLDALQAVKFAPAEREELDALVDTVGIERVKSLLSKRADLALTAPVVDKDGKPIGETKGAPPPSAPAIGAGSEDLMKALNTELSKAS